MIIEKRDGTFLEVTSNHGCTYRYGLDALLRGGYDIETEGIVYIGFQRGEEGTSECLSLTIDEVRQVRDELNEALKVFDKSETVESNSAITVNVNLDIQSVKDVEEQVKNIQEQLLKIGLVLS